MLFRSIMRSPDMKHWETISYVFPRIDDGPRYDLLEGTAYGQGQWASSCLLYTSVKKMKCMRIPFNLYMPEEMLTKEMKKADREREREEYDRMVAPEIVEEVQE